MVHGSSHPRSNGRRDRDTGPLGGGSGVVEADETYVGGKARNRAHARPAPKKAVVALVEREGHVRSFHVANVNAPSPDRDPTQTLF